MLKGTGVFASVEQNFARGTYAVTQRTNSSGQLGSNWVNRVSYEPANLILSTISRCSLSLSFIRLDFCLFSAVFNQIAATNGKNRPGPYLDFYASCSLATEFVRNPDFFIEFRSTLATFVARDNAGTEPLPGFACKFHRLAFPSPSRHHRILRRTYISLQIAIERTADSLRSMIYDTSCLRASEAARAITAISTNSPNHAVRKAPPGKSAPRWSSIITYVSPSPTP